MPLPIGHFSVGVAGALLFLVVTGLHTRTVQDGAIAIASGLWAMIPDVGAVVPGVGPTDSTSLANVFWFHRFLDSHPLTDSTTGNVVLVGLMAASVVVLVLSEGGDD